MYCSNCGSKLEDNAQFCSSCGQQKNRKKSSARIWLIIGIFATLLTAGAVGIGIFQVLSHPAEIAKQEAESKPQQAAEAVKKVFTPATSNSKQAEKEKTQIIKESMPKVFTVLTAEGLGSGFLYEKGGYIVTNAHVVAGYTDVIVKNHNGQESPARVVGISIYSDVALLKAENYAQSSPFSLELEQSEIGSEVIAIGSPQGLENSASIGYLTGTDRDVEYDFVYEALYQIDAQIDLGSSGGPLLDGKTGKVIGINSLLYTPKNTSFGFSIPLYTVAELINSWISNPMNETEVATAFNSNDEFLYSDPSAEEEAYSDEYEEFWNNYYENYSSNENQYEDSYGAEEYSYEKEISTEDQSYSEENWESYEFSYDEETLTNFILSFRDYYEEALYFEDFYYIQDML
ncbi:zinc-ribbon domain-containing protein [Lysinibacillus yapensis]|uniref:Zinc-ribbon domain-containing protein n=1 Tax=Ureibacillus yapensis TaxID=2304605 RepID=A0A396SD42_9BACL|nr:trypsin-like peptidase domain-containing protein [Lysinibacillus yapensis]RHW39516.1 zinc-ribbon domain-containing protein [Lysinibacillus yapensis]